MIRSKDIGGIYQQIRGAADPAAAFLAHIFQGVSSEEEQDLVRRGHKIYRGKVRDMVFEGGRVRVLHSDRLTAFDRFIDCVPYKGAMLNSISSFWFNEIRRDMPTHFIEQVNEREVLVEALTPIKVEMVVRAYMAGSIMRAYEGGERVFCGVKLPEGLNPYQQLPEPIITPTTKAAAFEHDQNTDAASIVASGVCSKDDWQTMVDLSLALFKFGSHACAQKGWLLVDTKYEFGKDSQGRIKIMDEIHTPDSSRFWVNSSYENRIDVGAAPIMLDKENVRRWLIQHGFKGFGDVPKVPPSVLLDLGEVYWKVCQTLTSGV